MRMNDAVQQGVASALCVCLAACSPLAALPKGKELAITVPDVASLQPDVSLPRASKSAAPATAVGAAGVGAGIAAAAACPGFTFLLCAPIFDFAGGVGGAGAVTLAADAPDPHRDVVRELEEKLAAFARANEINEELRLVLSEKAKPHWHVVPSSAQNSITVQVIGLSLRGENLEQVSLVVQATVAVRTVDAEVWRPAASANSWPQLGETLSPVSGHATVRGSFFHEGSSADVSLWMDESGEFLKAAVSAACESIAQQIVAALANRPAS